MKLSNLIKEALSPAEPRNVEIMLQKYPALKKSLTNNLKITNPEIINSINLLVSTPSTFELELSNGQKFKMEYAKIDFIAVINGKRFYLDGGADIKQTAQKELNNLLNKGELKSKADQEKEKAEAEAEASATEETPEIETPAEETPEEEVPVTEVNRLKKLAGIIKEGYDPIDDFIDELTEEAIKAGIISKDEIDDDDVRDALYDTYSESDFEISDLKVFKKLLKKYRGDKLNEGGIDEMARTSTNIKIGDTPYKVTDIKNAKTQAFVNQLIKIVRDSGEVGLSRGELAKKLGKQQPQINSLLNKMVEKGWLANVGGNVSSPKQDKPSKEKSSNTPTDRRFNGPEIERKIKALASKGYIVTKQNSKDDGSWYYKIQEPKDVADSSLKDRGTGIGYTAFEYKTTKPNTDYFYHNSHGGNDNNIGNIWNHKTSESPGPGGWYTFDQKYVDAKLLILSSIYF